MTESKYSAAITGDFLGFSGSSEKTRSQGTDHDTQMRYEYTLPFTNYTGRKSENASFAGVKEFED